MTLTAAGSFYTMFAEDNLPTGEYTGAPRGPQRRSTTARSPSARKPIACRPSRCSSTRPTRCRSTASSTCKLTASYYAGGKVAAGPCSGASRSSRTPGRRSSARASSSRPTGASPAPASSSRRRRWRRTTRPTTTAAPRWCSTRPSSRRRSRAATSIEATVTGADDQTVTNTQRVIALPPFVLGLKVPRYLEKAQTDRAADHRRRRGRQAASGHRGHGAAAEAAVALASARQRLLRRRRALRHRRRGREGLGDARSSAARSRSRCTLPLDGAGVYVVELEAHDRLGRAQIVAVDLYAGGERAGHLVAADDARLQGHDRQGRPTSPATRAALVLKSPFQKAEALAIVEAPDGNRYEWLDVKGGGATFQLPIENTYVPRCRCTSC